MARTAIRSVMNQEVIAAMAQLADYGNIHRFRVHGQGKQSLVFVKKHPEALDMIADPIINKQKYEARYSRASPRSIGQALRKHLHQNNIQAYPEDFP